MVHIIFTAANDIFAVVDSPVLALFAISACAASQFGDDDATNWNIKEADEAEPGEVNFLVVNGAGDEARVRLENHAVTTFSDMIS